MGASTILMAKAFPKSRFWGFDYHAGSVELARRRAEDAGVADRVTFDVAKSTDYPGKDYDLVACFDCLHDMEDCQGRRRPRAADDREGRHLDDRRALRRRCAGKEPQRRWSRLLLCVDDAVRSAFAGVRRSGARCAGGRGASAQRGGGWGFKRFRRATETPFNLVLEARP
jgi:threonine dehydrogenase-like Zn-dependent dehydrogenase